MQIIEQLFSFIMSDIININAILSQMQLLEFKDSLGGSLMNFLNQTQMIPLRLPNSIPIDLILYNFLSQDSIPVIKINRQIIMKLGMQKMMCILVDLSQ